MIKTKTEKLYKKIIDIDIVKYNKFIRDYKISSEKDKFLIYSGMRLVAKYERIKYPSEYLPEMTKEESDYYNKLK